MGLSRFTFSRVSSQWVPSHPVCRLNLFDGGPILIMSQELQDIDFKIFYQTIGITYWSTAPRPQIERLVPRTPPSPPSTTYTVASFAIRRVVGRQPPTIRRRAKPPGWYRHSCPEELSSLLYGWSWLNYEMYPVQNSLHIIPWDPFRLLRLIGVRQLYYGQIELANVFCTGQFAWAASSKKL